LEGSCEYCNKPQVSVMKYYNGLRTCRANSRMTTKLTVPQERFSSMELVYVEKREQNCYTPSRISDVSMYTCILSHQNDRENESTFLFICENEINTTGQAIIITVIDTNDRHNHYLPPLAKRVINRNNQFAKHLLIAEIVCIWC
jgi:hypothetical protein